MTRRLAIFASHVIQYQAPLFRLLAREPDIDLTVLYGSRRGADAFHDADMGTEVAWDVDLLEGYRHVFLRNFTTNPDGRFWRLVNPGLVPALVRGRHDAVIVMTGWGTFSSILAVMACRFLGIPCFLFGDSSFPPPVTGAARALRAGVLRLLFGSVAGAMASGTLNADYYRHYGMPDERIHFLPFAVDNERFAAASALTPDERNAMRERYGIPRDAVAFLFSAKLVERKDPATLLRAYARMRHRDRAAIVFAGDGELRGALESYAREHELPHVHFTGFVNQRALPRHYGMCDALVLPSTFEPRGLVVNEAMACGLPVVVSDRVGAIGDLARDGDNAFVFRAGDDAMLASQLDRLTSDAALRASMGARSREIIAGWSYTRAVEGIRAMLGSLES
ncbi:MAG TPA: glycosyltransferase family 4 protein [Thermoanaerobaculia bacterium]|nr:glycosyltransferase family 4 protein [Thermoanaerobaculia bacterium]